MSGGDDTLSRVALSHSAVKRWHERAGDLAREARKHGVRQPTNTPDELARIEADGALTLYVPMPDGAELSMRVEPHEWAWLGPRNQ
jgi:hypothetical protein